MSKSDQRKQNLRHSIMTAVNLRGLEVTPDFWFMLIFRTEADLKKIAKEVGAID